MRPHRTALLALLPLFIGACVGDSDSASLTHYGDELNDSVQDALALQTTHHKAVLAESNLGRMHDLEQTYTDEMGVRMGRAGDAQQSMELCGDHMGMAGAGTTQRFHQARTAMGESIDEASAELSRHAAAMKDLVAIDDGRVEERRHQQAMDAIMGRMPMRDDDLMNAMNAMADSGMSMMCSMHSHVHHQR